MYSVFYVCLLFSFIYHEDPFLFFKIKNGQVCLGYDLGHGNISDCVPYSINDGSWHKVQQFLSF